MSNGPQFFQTRMGQDFFQGLMPRISRSLSAISESVMPAPTFVMRGRGALIPVSVQGRTHRIDENGQRHLTFKVMLLIEFDGDAAGKQKEVAEGDLFEMPSADYTLEALKPVRWDALKRVPALFLNAEIQP